MPFYKRTSTVNPYIHTPLQYPAHSIRLLTIRRHHGSDMIHCTLTEHPFATSQPTPPYTALSYTWGSLQPSHTIQIDEKFFEIRENLWQFLRQMSSPSTDTDVFFWADAICINQQDISEKNAQVSLMGDIYRQTLQVYAWLGPAAQDSDSVFDLANSNKSVPPTRTHFTAMTLLCQREYWNRTWIVQEIALAAGEVILHCGNRKTTFREMRALCVLDMRILRDHITLPPEVLEEPLTGEEARGYRTKLSNSTLRTLFQSRPRSIDLTTLVKSYMNTVCLDPRDKIYAMKAMAEEEIEVDYSVSVVQLYWRMLTLCKCSEVIFAKKLQESLRLSMEVLLERSHTIMTICRPPSSEITCNTPFGSTPLLVPLNSASTDYVPDKVAFTELGQSAWLLKLAFMFLKEPIEMMKRRRMRPNMDDLTEFYRIESFVDAPHFVSIFVSNEIKILPEQWSSTPEWDAVVERQVKAVAARAKNSYSIAVRRWETLTDGDGRASLDQAPWNSWYELLS